MRGERATRQRIGCGILAAIGFVAGVLVIVWVTLCEVGTGGNYWMYIRRSLF